MLERRGLEEQNRIGQEKEAFLATCMHHGRMQATRLALGRCGETASDLETVHPSSYMASKCWPGPARSGLRVVAHTTALRIAHRGTAAAPDVESD
jgi:hypothetical protein